MIHTLETAFHYLNFKCEPVTDINEQVLPYIGTATEALFNTSNGVALAAPQIGEIYRWYIDYTGRVYINPTIVESGILIDLNEGCLSVPGTWVTKQRYHTVTLKYKTLLGSFRTDELQGLDAQIAQHEIDHLNGVTIENPS